MSLSQPSEINLTDNGRQALNAKALANSAHRVADNAYNVANNAQRTADGKNSIYRGSDPNTVPTAGLKEGDIYFTDNTLWTWNGSTWEKTVSDTTGAEIHAKVEAAMQESQKSVADLKAEVESKVSEIDSNLTTTTSDIKNSLSSVRNDLLATKSDLADTKNNLSTTTSDIKNSLSSVRNDLLATKSDLADTKTSLSTTVADLQKHTGQLSGSLETANSKIEYNSQAIAEVKHTADSLTTRMANAEGNVSSLQQTAQGLTTRVTNTESNVSSLQQTASKLQSDLNNAKGDISSVKQTAEEVSTTVSNIRVGGRNLVLGTQEAKTIFDGTGYTNLRDLTFELGYYWPDLQRVDLKKHLSNLGLTYDDTLTVTGNLTISKNGTLAKSDFANDFAVGLFRTTHNWNIHAKISKRDLVDGQTAYKIKETFVIGDSEQLGWKSPSPYCWLNMAPSGYSISVDHYKVEKGTMATDWTPAPEDTDQAISKVSQTADAIRADLTNTKGDVASVKATASSLQSQITDNKNNISALKQTADSLTTRMANAEGNVSSLQQTAQGLTTRVTNTESNVSSLQQTASKLQSDLTNAKGDISSVKQTANSLNAYIQESRGSSTLASILSMDPDHSSIAQVVNGQIAAAIGTYSDGTVRIDGKALHINADTKIENATIKSAMIDSIDASKITTGTLDASHINVINLDANSITTGSLRAALYSVTDFTNYTVSASSPWDFNYTKSTHGNWFLIGEPISDHVYNGPKDANHNKLTPYMYVTSRGSSDGTRFTVTVWKDNDPTQYQRVWNGSSWSDWVMLPNSQNLVSAINLSPDNVKISGKNIELDGNTTVTGTLDLMQKNTNWVNQDSNYHNPWSWNNAHIYFNNYLQLIGENCDVTYEDNFHLNGGRKFYSIGTLTPGYLKFTSYQNKVKLTDEKFDGQIARTYIDSSRIETNDIWAGNLRIVGHHIRATDDKFVMVSNHAGTNFDNNGSVGFQVYGGIGLGQNTMYTASRDLYIQNGNAVQHLGQSYSSARKTTIHAQKLVSQEANTVSSRLSVKTDITPVTYDRALAAVEGTDMYDYRYVNDDSGQHYVSGIIDDVNPEDPQYHMDDMLINKERTARIDANLVGYHHVILQELLKKIDELEIKLKLLESKEK